MTWISKIAKLFSIFNMKNITFAMCFSDFFFLFCTWLEGVYNKATKLLMLHFTPMWFCTMPLHHSWNFGQCCSGQVHRLNHHCRSLPSWTIQITHILHWNSMKTLSTKALGSASEVKEIWGKHGALHWLF